ncbi:MAG: histidine kinase [Cellulosilyticaceae bacterium]
MERFKSIKVLMVTCFSLIMAIIMLFTGMTLYRKFNDTATDYASQSVDQLTTQVKYSIDTYTRNMMDISNTIYYKIIKNQNITDNNFWGQMNLIATANNNIANLAIFKGSGELIAASRYLQVDPSRDVTKESWFQNAIETPENVHFSSPHRQLIFRENDPLVVSLSRVVSLNEDGNIIQGVLLVDMNLTGIEKICAPILEGGTGQVYIIAPNGDVVYGNETDVTRHNNQEQINNLQEGVVVNKRSKQIITTKIAGYTGWRIVGVWDLDKLVFDFANTKDFFILILMIGLMLCVGGTLFISSRLAAPLYRLQKSMKCVEAGDFDSRLDEGGEYIVSELSKTFNKMVERIRALMDEIVREQDSKRKKELEVLQSQINPHFLYNTLDSIIWLVEDERVEEATRMITALSRFFRIGISSGKTMITVRQELEHARNYLTIQKIRYKNKFEYTLEADECVMEAKCLKLILQPLIENALYHGIEYIHHPGLVQIRAWQEGEDLYLMVKDNGVGMNEETCVKLLDESYEIHSKGSGVGSRNVHKRIKLYYGDQYGITVESEIEEGTTLRIRIPLQYA